MPRRNPPLVLSPLVQLHLAVNTVHPLVIPAVAVRLQQIAELSEPEKPEERVLTINELKGFERENIVRALRKSNYKVYGEDGAASLIGSKPTTLISRIKALDIPTKEYSRRLMSASSFQASSWRDRVEEFYPNL